MCESLYFLSVKSVTKDLSGTFNILNDSNALTDSMKFDLCWVLFNEELKHQVCSNHETTKELSVRAVKILRFLSKRLSELHVFASMLNQGQRRIQLFQLVSSVAGLAPRLRGEPEVIAALAQKTKESLENGTQCQSAAKKCLTESLAIAQFFNDSGWYNSAALILETVRTSCQRLQESGTFATSKNDARFLDLLTTECRLRLLHAFSAFCKFDEADRIYSDILVSLNACRVLRSGLQVKVPKLDNEPTTLVSLPAQYLELAYFCFTKSQYHLAYDWSMKAVKLLSKDLSPKIIIDVLRIASKSCVVKGQFAKAKLLVQEAVLMAKEIYGESHPKYADCLMDFGFYLQNSDGASASIQAYKSALKV